MPSCCVITLLVYWPIVSCSLPFQIYWLLTVVMQYPPGVFDVSTIVFIVKINKLQPFSYFLNSLSYLSLVVAAFSSSESLFTVRVFSDALMDTLSTSMASSHKILLSMSHSDFCASFYYRIKSLHQMAAVRKAGICGWSQSSTKVSSM